METELKRNFSTNLKNLIETPDVSNSDKIKIHELGSQEISRWIEIASEDQDKRLMDKAKEKTDYKKLSNYFDYMNMVILTSFIIWQWY